MGQQVQVFVERRWEAGWVFERVGIHVDELIKEKYSENDRIVEHEDEQVMLDMLHKFLSIKALPKETKEKANQWITDIQKPSRRRFNKESVKNTEDKKMNKMINQMLGSDKTKK